MLKLTKKQKEFILNANHRYNIKYGATRSGKTYLDLLYIIPSRLRERTGKDGLNVILGVSKATIQRNVIEPLQEIYGTELVHEINSQNEAILFGEKVYCLGAEKINQVSKLRGSSIKYCYCDELAEYNKEVFELLKSRLDKSYSCLDATLNPKETSHWLKKDFLDTAEEKNIDLFLQHYTIFDNDFLPEDVKENLCKEYEGTVYYNRYVLGQWCNAEGIIFRQIAENKERYLIDKANNKGLISIGIDFGGNKSAHTFVASKIQRNFSLLEVLKSQRIEAKGTDTYDISSKLIQFIKEILLEYGHVDTIFADCNEQAIINTLNKDLRNSKLHIPINNIVENSIKTPLSDRIKGISILLNIDKIKFVKNKTNTVIEALQTAIYDDKEADVWLDDGTSDIDSLDAFVYSFSKWFNALLRYN